MEKILLGIHLVTALAIIGLVLLQQGKGAEVGASFGAGASQTLFGSAGSWNFFSKMTAILATVFFVTSISLAVLASRGTDVTEDYLPEVREQSGEIPAATPQESEGAIPEPAGAIPESQ